MLRSLESITLATSRIFMFVASAVIVLMAVHVAADMIAKYLFNSPIVGTLEIVSSYYMVAVSFLPLAYTQWHREHLVVEFATQKLSPHAVRAMDTVVYAFCIALLGLYTWQTTVAAIEKTEIGESWETGFFELPVWPTRWLLPASLAAMALCMIVQVASGFGRRDVVRESMMPGGAAGRAGESGRPICRP